MFVPTWFGAGQWQTSKTSGTKKQTNASCYLQIEDALRSHIKEEIEHTQVRQKTMFLLIDLIIRSRLEVGIGQGMLGVDGQAEIRKGGRREGG